MSSSSWTASCRTKRGLEDPDDFTVGRQRDTLVFSTFSTKFNFGSLHSFIYVKRKETIVYCEEIKREMALKRATS